MSLVVKPEKKVREIQEKIPVIIAGESMSSRIEKMAKKGFENETYFEQALNMMKGVMENIEEHTESIVTCMSISDYLREKGEYYYSGRFYELATQYSHVELQENRYRYAGKIYEEGMSKHPKTEECRLFAIEAYLKGKDFDSYDRLINIEKESKKTLREYVEIFDSLDEQIFGFGSIDTMKIYKLSEKSNDKIESMIGKFYTSIVNFMNEPGIGEDEKSIRNQQAREAVYRVKRENKTKKDFEQALERETFRIA